MSENPIIKVLNGYIGRPCKIVYRDGVPHKAKAFYGKLVEFDSVFQVWEGSDDSTAERTKRVTFNHNDVSRIVFEFGAV